MYVYAAGATDKEKEACRLNAAAPEMRRARCCRCPLRALSRFASARSQLRAATQGGSARPPASGSSAQLRAPSSCVQPPCVRHEDAWFGGVDQHLRCSGRETPLPFANAAPPRTASAPPVCTNNSTHTLSDKILMSGLQNKLHSCSRARQRQPWRAGRRGQWKGGQPTAEKRWLSCRPSPPSTARVLQTWAAPSEGLRAARRL